MNILVLVIGILSLIVMAIALLLGITIGRIKKLTRGNSAQSLESIIKENNALILDLRLKVKQQAEEIITIQKDAMNTLQNVNVIRFNPFKETGGSQSFVVALTDKNNNGVVISSLYARERVNIFAKPIIAGGSEYTLSKEEQEALNQSKK